MCVAIHAASSRLAARGVEVGVAVGFTLGRECNPWAPGKKDTPKMKMGSQEVGCRNPARPEVLYSREFL